MYFSTMSPDVLRQIEEALPGVVETLAFPANLRINAGKTRHSSLKNRRRVTGLILTPQGTVSLGRPFKRRLRSLVHQWDALSPEDQESTRGLISYAQSVEPDFMNRLVIKFGAHILTKIRR